MDSQLIIRVTTSYFCCGIVVEEGRVVDAAPIMRWSIGMPVGRVQEWVLGRAGRMELMGGVIAHD